MPSLPQGADELLDKGFPGEPPLAVPLVRAIWVHTGSVSTCPSFLRTAGMNRGRARKPATSNIVSATLDLTTIATRTRLFASR